MHVIYGAAGTGKSFELCRRIRECQTNYMVLAPTHSALENLRRQLPDIPQDRFKTIYSYFQINYEKEIVMGPIVDVQTLFIDEFSLIKKSLFKKMMLKTKADVTICGDVTQLSPIYNETLKISFGKLKTYPLMPYHIIEHDYKTLFSLKRVQKADKTLLTVNHRSGESVMKIIQQLFYDMNDDLKYLTTMQVAGMLDEYTLLTSTYELQRPVYELYKRSHDGIEKNGLLFFVGCQYMVTETDKNFKNGQVLDCVVCSDKRIVLADDHGGEYDWNAKMKLTPLHILTAHKSQGLTIPKVIVCVENMFDVAMFYTMCTRAAEDLRFYRTTQVDLKPILKEFHELMSYYGYDQESLTE